MNILLYSCTRSELLEPPRLLLTLSANATDENTADEDLDIIRGTTVVFSVNVISKVSILIDSYEWVIEDAEGIKIGSGTEPTFSFTFNNFGTHTVKLRVTSGDGSIIKRTLEVTPLLDFIISVKSVTIQSLPPTDANGNAWDASGLNPIDVDGDDSNPDIVVVLENLTDNSFERISRVIQDVDLSTITTSTPLIFDVANAGDFDENTNLLLPASGHLGIGEFDIADDGEESVSIFGSNDVDIISRYTMTETEFANNNILETNQNGFQFTIELERVELPF